MGKFLPEYFDYIKDETFLLIDALRMWDATDYENPGLLKILNYLTFMCDAKALAEQIEAMDRGLA